MAIEEYYLKLEPGKKLSASNQKGRINKIVKQSKDFKFGYFFSVFSNNGYEPRWEVLRFIPISEEAGWEGCNYKTSEAALQDAKHYLKEKGFDCVTPFNLEGIIDNI
ncbi:hypothetical protein GOV06_02050 [Candidatus Woesearchaeota archaeon]|nr:hypothetical protein [Candidatus Woesearchaeota archaeon]